MNDTGASHSEQGNAATTAVGPRAVESVDSDSDRVPELDKIISTRHHERFALPNLPITIKKSTVYTELLTNQVTLTVGLNNLGVPLVIIGSDDFRPAETITNQRFAVLALLAQLAFALRIEPAGLEAFIDKMDDCMGWFYP